MKRLPVLKIAHLSPVASGLHKCDYNSMAQSPPSEPDSSSASQEIPRVLWNPEVYYPHSQASATSPKS